MNSTHVLKTRVSAETKQRVQQLAQQQLLTESIWLRQIVDATLRERGPSSTEVTVPAPTAVPSDRVYVRLRPDDYMLLRERATARGMPMASYLSVLTRAHLRRLTPLPKDELQTLKRSIAELGAIGRNLNQIARISNETGRVSGPGRDDLRIFLKVCEGLRDHVKSLIRANVISWEVGHAAHD